MVITVLFIFLGKCPLLPVNSQITNIQLSNQGNNHGYNFIIKKKNFLVDQKRKLATIAINKYIFLVF